MSLPDEKLTAVPWPPDYTGTRYTIKKLRKHAVRIIEIVEEKE
jgi:hypothetical protein